MKNPTKGAAVFYNPSRSHYVPIIAFRIIILYGQCLIGGKSAPSNFDLTKMLAGMSSDIVKPGWQSITKAGSTKPYLQEEIEWILTYLRHAGLMLPKSRALSQQGINMVRTCNWTDIKTICDNLMLFDKARAAVQSLPDAAVPFSASSNSSPAWIFFIKNIFSGFRLTAKAT